MTDRVHDDQDLKLNQPIHETAQIVNTASLRQRDEEDAACLSIAVEEQNHEFTACLIQKAVVEDYMVEEGGKERHGSLKTYKIESSKERELQPTHHKESSMFDEAYKGNKLKLAVNDRNDNAVDVGVDMPGAVATNKPDD
jgi:hypothetical protein